MQLYLRLVIEELRDGSGYRYMATSRDLPGLLVVGDSIEEVTAKAPGVASALMETLDDLATAAERRDEPAVSHEDLVAELKRDDLLSH